MSKKLDEALYQFANDGTESKEKVLNHVMQKINSPVKPKIKYGKYVTVAISLCLIITISANFNVIADSISNILNTLFPAENIMMNEIHTNRFEELLDASLYSAREAGTAIVLDEDSIEYQLVYGPLEPVETPCYVYLFYYRGYLKAIVLDEKTDNIKEIEEWLRINGGIVAKAANTPEEAAKILDSGGSVRITLAKIREVMGDDCMLPVYLPDGRKSGNIIQYNENIGTVNITYFYEGKADFDLNGQLENYIALGITNTVGEFGKNLTANLTVTKNIEVSQINGYDVYISDGYYVWEYKGFVYVLYTTFATHEENVKLIENMK